MATIGECATALSSQIATATGLRAFDYVPEDLEPPALFVRLDRIEVVTMKLGQVDIWFDVVVFTSRTSDRVGQQRIYEYLSPTHANSIVKAIHADTTLGGVLSSNQCSAISQEARSLGAEELAAYGYFGAVVPVLIATNGA